MYPSQVVVDASIWVARLIPNDVNHAVSSKWLAGFRKSGGLLITPSLMLPEVAGAVARRTGRPDLADEALEVLQKLGNLRIVAMNNRLIRDAASIAGKHALRGADSVYVALASALDVSLLSLDAEHASRGGKLVTVIDPAEWPDT